MLGRLEARGFSQVAQQPVDVRTTVWYNPGMVSANFMVPAMIGIILQFLTTMLTATSIVRERERGTIEQLIVTPLRSWELVLGKLAPYVVIAFLTTIEVLIVGVVAFKMPINGSVLLLLLLTGLFLVTTLATGLFISTLANTQQEAMMTTMLTLLPAIYLSGFFFPIAAMPKWLQIISLLFPLRYFLVIARGIVVKGVGVSALWQQVFALILFGTLVTTAAVLRFRRSLD